MPPREQLKVFTCKSLDPSGLLFCHERQSPFGQPVGGIRLEDLPQSGAGLLIPAGEVVEQGAVRLQRERQRVQLYGSTELRDGLVEPPA